MALAVLIDKYRRLCLKDIESKTRVYRMPLLERATKAKVPFPSLEDAENVIAIVAYHFIGETPLGVMIFEERS